MIMVQINHKIFPRNIRFLVTIMICVAIAFGAQKLLKTWKEGFVTLHPKKTLVVIIDLGQQEKFFEQLTRFSDAYAFDIHIGPTTLSGDTFNINMSRKDVMVIANNVFDKKTFDIVFYDKNPANPAPQETIESLFSNLKRFISEIPNVTITEER